MKVTSTAMSKLFLATEADGNRARCHGDALSGRDLITSTMAAVTPIVTESLL